ncbi:MAG: hypothetical protein U1C71_00070, partial [archaeon]|nr:hypothetical protein [archaeon]
LGKFIFNADAGWDEVKGFLHTFKFYIGQINNLNEGELEIIVPVLFSNQIEAAFEVGGLRDPLCDGSQQAAIDIGILDRFVAVGGIIHYIDMDGPFSDSVMDPCGFDITRASSETVEYMQAMRAQYTGVKIGLTIAAPHYSVGPYPSSTWKDSGDLLAQLDVFLQVVQDNGEQLDFYQSETRFDRPPWVDDWRKYVLIQEYFRDKGIRFGIYYGSAEGGHTSNQAFYENTLRDLVDFKAAGGDPDDIAISSYFPLPDDLYPETDAYSMTNTTRDFYRLYHQLYDNDG